VRLHVVFGQSWSGLCLGCGFYKYRYGRDCVFELFRSWEYSYQYIFDDFLESANDGGTVTYLWVPVRVIPGQWVSTFQYCTVQYCSSDLQYSTVLYCTDLQYCTVQYCDIEYSTVQYCTVL
jgi:hypothetical protein